MIKNSKQFCKTSSSLPKGLFKFLLYRNNIIIFSINTGFLCLRSLNAQVNSIQHCSFLYLLVSNRYSCFMTDYYIDPIFRCLSTVLFKDDAYALLLERMQEDLDIETQSIDRIQSASQSRRRISSTCILNIHI